MAGSASSQCRQKSAQAAVQVNIVGRDGAIGPPLFISPTTVSHQPRNSVLPTAVTDKQTPRPDPIDLDSNEVCCEVSFTMI